MDARDLQLRVERLGLNTRDSLDSAARQVVEESESLAFLCGDLTTHPSWGGLCESA